MERIAETRTQVRFATVRDGRPTIAKLEIGIENFLRHVCRVHSLANFG